MICTELRTQTHYRNIPQLNGPVALITMITSTIFTTIHIHPWCRRYSGSTVDVIYRSLKCLKFSCLAWERTVTFKNVQRPSHRLWFILSYFRCYEALDGTTTDLSTSEIRLFCLPYSHFDSCSSRPVTQAGSRLQNVLFTLCARLTIQSHSSQNICCLVVLTAWSWNRQLWHHNG